MLLDGRSVAHGSVLDADVCVVGAGAAGITIARELADGPIQVLVLESGGLGPDPATQELARGEVAGHAYPALETTRVRVLGGSTTHWNGWCRPLDAVDFEERPAIPHSGWPFGLEELDPYYARAHPICQLGPYDYRAGRWAAAVGGPLLGVVDSSFETTVFQFSPPTNFGRVYRDELDRARNVRVLLHSNAVGVAASTRGRRIERLRVATLGGRRFDVRARRYVLACGGIENARLLLAWELGAVDGPVGRFFAEHPHSPVAVAVLPARLGSVYAGGVGAATRVRAGLATTEGLARANGLLRASVTIDPIETDPYIDHDDPSERERADFGSDVASMARSLQGTELAVYALYLRTEQAPNPTSRVVLANARDALGVPRARLEWRLGELDRRSTARSVAILGGTVGRLRLGRVYSRPDSEAGFWGRVGGGYHHMGTTRMGTDPATSVVDQRCQVHGVENLYVAGSSVFPTYGYANPTLTIVALALRLSDELARGRS